MSRARIFKLLRTQGIGFKESIPDNQLPLPPASWFVEGIAQFTVRARVNMCYRFHTWFLHNSRNRLFPSKNFSSAEYDLQHDSTPLPPVPQTVCVILITGRRVELKTMPMNRSWSKFYEKITNELASSFLNDSSPSRRQRTSRGDG